MFSKKSFIRKTFQIFCFSNFLLPHRIKIANNFKFAVVTTNPLATIRRSRRFLSGNLVFNIHLQKKKKVPILVQRIENFGNGNREKFCLFIESEKYIPTSHKMSIGVPKRK